MKMTKLESNAAVSRDLYIELLKQTLSASVYDESAWYVFQEGERHNDPSRRRFPAVRNRLRDLIVRFLRKRSILVLKAQSLKMAARAEGRDWPFLGYTMVGHRRLDNVRKCIEDVLLDNIPGDLIEAGVWRGGTTIFMRGVLKAYGVTDRKVWVADSFEGLPVPVSSTDGADLSGVAYLKVSLEQVRANFERFSLLDDQVQFLKGRFQDTLPEAPIGRLAILRLDGDLYSSTIEPLRSLYDRVSPGGYVIVDDYHSWASCRQAVDDFIKQHHIEADIKPIDWAGAYWRLPR